MCQAQNRLSFRLLLCQQLLFFRLDYSFSFVFFLDLLLYWLQASALACIVLMLLSQLKWQNLLSLAAVQDGPLRVRSLSEL